MMSRATAPRLVSRAAAPRLVMIGLGSSVLKIALHPGAAGLRRDLEHLGTVEGLVWIDHASRRDVISFERSEPIATLGLRGRGPQLESVHPRAMVDAATWKRIRWQPLRIHRQYVMGNGRRYFLDHGLLVCGPLPAGVRPDEVIDANGAIGARIAERAEAPGMAEPARP